MRGVANIRILLTGFAALSNQRPVSGPRFLSVERCINPKCCRNASRSIKSFDTADQNGSGVVFRAAVTTLSIQCRP